MIRGNGGGSGRPHPVTRAANLIEWTLLSGFPFGLVFALAGYEALS